MVSTAFIGVVCVLGGIAFGCATNGLVWAFWYVSIGIGLVVLGVKEWRSRWTMTGQTDTFT